MSEGPSENSACWLDDISVSINRLDSPSVTGYKKTVVGYQHKPCPPTWHCCSQGSSSFGLLGTGWWKKSFPRYMLLPWTWALPKESNRKGWTTPSTTARLGPGPTCTYRVRAAEGQAPLCHPCPPPARSIPALGNEVV